MDHRRVPSRMVVASRGRSGSPLSEDDETFAKLKRNLRNRHAVTNSLVVQRLHVFVKSQKQKQLQQQREQQQLQ